MCREERGQRRVLCVVCLRVSCYAGGWQADPIVGQSDRPARLCDQPGSLGITPSTRDRPARPALPHWPPPGIAKIGKRIKTPGWVFLQNLPHSFTWCQAEVKVQTRSQITNETDCAGQLSWWRVSEGQDLTWDELSDNSEEGWMFLSWFLFIISGLMDK